MKKCFKCGVEKPITEFYVHKAMSDGHLGKCKDCTRKDVAKNYRENHEQYLEYEKSRLDDPKCPGNINRQKLEMFDEMLSALRETRKAMQIAGGDLTCARLDGIITRARTLQEASR